MLSGSYSRRFANAERTLALSGAAALGLVAAVALVLLLPPPAVATFPGAPGKVVFSRSSAGAPAMSGDLWIVSRSGRQQLLTRGSADDTEPTFSGDGRWIAFARRTADGSSIWAMRPDGNRKGMVVSGPGESFNPTFFPGGRSIVYEAFVDERYFHLYTVRLDGSRPKLLVRDAADPAISPSGRFVAYSARRDGGGIRLLDRRSGRSRWLTRGSAQELDFSPSGRRIVFTGQRRCRRGGPTRFGLLAVGLRGGGVKRLKLSCRREFISPVHSPDGRRLLFVRKRLAATAAGLRFSLGLARPGGRTVGGARWHRRGADEQFPAWQPLPRRGRR